MCVHACVCECACVRRVSLSPSLSPYTSPSMSLSLSLSLSLCLCASVPVRLCALRTLMHSEFRTAYSMIRARCIFESSGHSPIGGNRTALALALPPRCCPWRVRHVCVCVCGRCSSPINPAWQACARRVRDVKLHTHACAFPLLATRQAHFNLCPDPMVRMAPGVGYLVRSRQRRASWHLECRWAGGVSSPRLGAGVRRVRRPSAARAQRPADTCGAALWFALCAKQ